MATSWIGLGSNLEQPKQQLLKAQAELEKLGVVTISRLYSSSPMGPQDQPDYVNAVAMLKTELAPIALLDALQAIENEHGRVRNRRWGERTLDLDLLIYDQQQINHPRLTVPHPGIAERDFVLKPLHELAPELKLPDGRPIEQLLENCSDHSLRLID
ncbi:2-amino-4-hydroxy-6-hydroxymethyldihydropteridine diphosphokinase [Pelagibaculum spongiae]|uniref:2-amino-4-hydroxy-6-hydroxymethyldihydropteridine pyrophosphokinase n=1 Tax=Pelagibaculum spongiae TaxID=2080658 RepID=A0A2V1H5Y0_9GAMM|nr:2-amino-4-hydroxy-6-hydroxymethyldihydropteridine diphosphokinase [Pelagibaculum spongiae]